MTMNALFFKRIFKILILTIGIVALIFVIIAAIIQIPSIQTKLVGYATSFVSNKTHTVVAIEKICIAFPKSIVIDKLYLEDEKHDTLVFAETTRINISLFKLFHNRITINALDLQNATVKLNSTRTNPLFNYNFLITAFADSTKIPDSTATSSWQFSLNTINLSNVRFAYNDQFAGMNVLVFIANSAIDIDALDLDNSIYKLGELTLNGLNTMVCINESNNVSTTNSKGELPKISAEKLILNNATINFTDSVGNLSVFTKIDQCKLESTYLDLQNTALNFEKVYLANSEIKYHTFPPPLDSLLAAEPSENSWKLSLNRIELIDNTIVYKAGNEPEVGGGFDPNYLKLYHLTMLANDFNYSTDETKVDLEKFEAIDQNNFAITQFETNFGMNNHSITAKKLKANVGNSALDADFSIHYASMDALIDSLQFDSLSLHLKNANFMNKDILYFNSELIQQPFFKNTSTVTTASGIIEGSMSRLRGENLVLKTGNNTRVTTDFEIAGLSNFGSATYHFPNLEINSGKRDIEMMAGNTLPKTIEIPDTLNLRANFNGQVKFFDAAAILNSSFGDANLQASVDMNQKFSGKLTLENLDLGRLLKDTAMFGPISLTMHAVGKGLELKTIQADINAEASALTLNNYCYHNLKMEGTIANQIFDGKLNLKDKNADFEINGQANLNPGKERYTFHLNLRGMDLKKLNFTTNDTRIGLVASANFTGKTVDNLNGKAEISNIVVAHEAKKYKLETVILKTTNIANKSQITLNSPLMDVNYVGRAFPTTLSSGLIQFLNGYFAFSDTLPIATQPLQDFDFQIKLRNHPILSEIIFPELHEFRPGNITGSYDSANHSLKLNAIINKITYGTTDVTDFSIVVNSNAKALNYKVLCKSMVNSTASLDNFLVDGKLSDNQMLTTISSIDEKQNKKLAVATQLVKTNTNYKLSLDPNGFYLMNQKWNIAADNFIEFGKQGFLIHHFFLNNNESRINVASVNSRFNDDVNLEIKNFTLDDIFGILQKDSSLVKGVLDGNILMKRVNNSYGLIADAKIMNLVVNNIPIGNLSVNAENPTAERFKIDLKLWGGENNLTANGFYLPNGGNQSIGISTAIQSLSMQTLQAFSMGNITKASGKLSGNFMIEGNATLPEITGELTFNNAFFTPSFLNNALELKHETIRLKKDGIYFDSFTILDRGKHSAVVDGVVNMHQFGDFKFDLNLSTKDFLLFNTTNRDNKEFFGRMIIDSKIGITGPMSLPVVNGTVKLKKGSRFTIAVPEERLTTDKGEDVVEFETKANLNPILYQADKKEVQESALTGFDVSAIIEIDKEASLCMLMDPTSTDSLVVRGDAALSFTIDRSGKMSLTGAFNLNDGSYMASLESLIKRKFDIDRGSTIVWNGDPFDADISINARYLVRASPIDLMADQLLGLSEAEKNGYKQRYPFFVFLKMRGKILQPEISFEIALPPDDKGILSGAVNQKLTMLNEDESALNKQVFALLVLGRFVQENPMQTDAGGGTSTLVRATVGKFLSQQLNQLSSKVLSGVDLNFDIQSFNEYQTGQAQGRTQVDIGLKKQLFDERLSIQLGGSVDVEGEKASQNSASTITSDVDVEYKLTKDGHYRLNAFRHNQYEGVIEGQLVETGAGIIYVRDFNNWKTFFSMLKKKSVPSEKGEIK